MASAEELFAMSDNHPTQAQGISGGQQGNGKMLPFEGASIDGVIASEGISTPLPAASADSLFRSLNPGALGQIPNEQMEQATNYMVTPQAEKNGLGPLQDVTGSEIKQTNLSNLTNEARSQGIGAGLGGGGQGQGG
ncbi:MAG: hypothetical protein KGP29_00300 [Proteobacteria bacterium]|nr:hypothetical protein [Pseudomonadota bacterium]